VRRRPLLTVALGVILLAFAGTWVYGEVSDTQCYGSLRAVPEGTAFHEEAGLWPPGGKCVFELPNGRERVEAGPVPWFEWILLALCAGAVMAVAQLWQGVTRRVHSRARPE
jgi:hypothetical protein